MMYLNSLYKFVKILSVINLSTLTTASANPVVEAFEESKIVPDFIDKAPEEFLWVIYPEKVAFLGNNFTMTEVLTQPYVYWAGSDDCYYLLAMIGPGLVGAVANEARHWLVGNIKGADINEGDVLASYLTSVPPPGSVFHRYRFFVYQQPDCQKVTYDEPVILNEAVAGRFGFHLREFTSKYNLGDPVWGNFMYIYSNVDSINPAAGVVQDVSKKGQLNI